jgi:hypothetical protein
MLFFARSGVVSEIDDCGRNGIIKLLFGLGRSGVLAEVAGVSIPQLEDPSPVYPASKMALEKSRF